MRDNNSGEVYQVLDLIKYDEETNDDTLSTNINMEEEEGEKQEEETYFE